MDKAIEILTESVKNYQIALESKFSSSKIKQIAAKKLKQHNEAIAELTAHKAKIESLKEWANKTTNFALATDDFNKGYAQAKADIFQKLEELDI